MVNLTYSAGYIKKQKATEVAFIHLTFTIIIQKAENLTNHGRHWFAVVA